MRVGFNGVWIFLGWEGMTVVKRVEEKGNF